MSIKSASLKSWFGNCHSVSFYFVAHRFASVSPIIVGLRSKRLDLQMKMVIKLYHASQAFSHDLISGCPKCAIGPAQITKKDTDLAKRLLFPTVATLNYS